MERVILHSDMNAFYASIEQLRHPELGPYLAVGGNPEKRHGIILAKSQKAKECGVKTAEPLWAAKQKCPELVVIPPDFPFYMMISKKARYIYYRYTDMVESFGLDECWMDVTGSRRLYGDGFEIATKISRDIKASLGLTVSIGVSFNKIFAKFGSDYRKPDAITVINRDNYQKIIWPKPVNTLLYAGKATSKKLNRCGIRTIGELAMADEGLLRQVLGKMGPTLKAFACGNDVSPVKNFDEKAGGNLREVKSVGNGFTTPRDLTTVEDVKVMLYILTESVAMRLRQAGLMAQAVQIHIRNKELQRMTRQAQLKKPSHITSELADCALGIFEANYDWRSPVRALSVQATGLVSADTGVQLDLFTDEMARTKKENLDQTIDTLRKRYGNNAVRRALTLEPSMCDLDPKQDHVVHPDSFF